MNEIDRIGLLAELSEAHCELNHGPDTRPQDHQAVNYIVMPFGYKQDDVQEVALRDLVIPVCHECIQALLQDDWTLFYCFECSRSQWVYRKMARNQYRHHILWLRGCPGCTAEFGGLYFNDLPKMFGMTELKLAV